MRDLIEKGRVIEFKCKTMTTQLGVIVDFITQGSFVVQMVCARTGKACGRKVMTPKNLLLTSFVIELNDTEAERGALFDESVEAAIKEAVAYKQNKEDYQSFIQTEKRREMNDFERFLEEQKDLAKASLLKAKGF
ncbi:large subunit ribosomal protein L14e [Nematocida displodere]|uniref:Large subunit ribosomal protein L14e n=1 Tax=Nematocida displodere TaxID=1805483 RepID=A0A177EBY0_9MICR|nr:large subunit ribosomal protein L14e [Nematocida displodere]